MLPSRISLSRKNRLTSVLVSRFLLNLRSIYLSSQEVDSIVGDSTTDPVASSLEIAVHSVAGNLGAPLDGLAFDTEGNAEFFVADDIAYVSRNPLAIELHSSSEGRKGYDSGNRGLLSLKGYVSYSRTILIY